MRPHFTKACTLARVAAALALSVLARPAHGGEDEYQVDRLAKLIAAREHGKVLSIDETDHNSAELSLPNAPNVEIGEVDGDISVEFLFDVPPTPGGAAEALMTRVAALGGWRSRIEAEALLRRCLTQSAALWRNGGFYSLQAPQTVTRVHTPTFSCGPFTNDDKRMLQIHFQRPSKG